MKQELAQAIQAVLQTHGINPAPSNPIEVRVVSVKGDLNEVVTLPLPAPEDIERWRMIKIESLPTLSLPIRKVLINGNFITVGQVLDLVEQRGYRGMLGGRVRKFGLISFIVLRNAMWDLGLVLSNQWRIKSGRDYLWYSRFRSD